MDDTMSVKEAAARLNVAEKSIFRYLKRGTLTSTKIGVQHYIPCDQVERLALSRRVPTDEKTRLDNRITTLYDLVGALDFRVRELEEQVRNLKNVQTPVQTPQERVRTPVAVSPSHTTPIREQATTAPRIQRQSAMPEMPPGTLSLQEFADALGIARRTLLELTIRHNFEHIAIPDPTRPKETKRYFSPEQQASVKHWRAEHATKRG
jgi:excisionase family DNA binding protein